MFGKYEYPQHYYYYDREFQLELNLQSVRRDLVLLLEADSSSSDTTSVSTSSDSAWSSNSSSSESELSQSAPPPHKLPLPQWYHLEIPEEDFYRGLEAWVRASAPHPVPYFLPGDAPRFLSSKNLGDRIHSTWPPLPGSMWDEGTVQETLVREREYRKGGINVRDFFKHFRERQNPGPWGKVLNDKCLKQSSCTKYTYF